MTQAVAVSVEPDPFVELSEARLASLLVDEHRLRMKRQILAMLVDALREPVVLVDAEDQVFAATDTWLRLMDHAGPPAGSLSAVCRLRFGAQATRHIVTLVRRAFAHKAPQSAEVPIDLSGGKVAITCTPLVPSPDGAVEEVVVGFNAARGSSTPHGLSAVSASSVTPREHEVLLLLAEGQTIAGIAERLQVRQSTVRGHLKSLLAKLQAHTQLQAVIAGMRAGLVPAPR